MAPLLRGPISLRPIRAPAQAFYPFRALHIDPSPSQPSSSKPAGSTTTGSSSPSSSSTNAQSKDGKRGDYGKEGTNSGEYGNEDVEAAIKAAEVPKPQEKKK